MSWRKENVIERLRTIFNDYGWDIGTEFYDTLEDEDKPSRSTLRRILGTKPWREIIKEVRDDTESTKEIGKDHLVRTVTQLQKKLSKQQNVNQLIIDTVMASLSKISFRPSRIPPSEKKPGNLSFHALRSDDQVGEVVDSDFTQGIGNYNIKVFQERLDRWTEKMCLFREQDKKSLGLNKLSLYFLGDHVEGETIYHGQAFFIDLHVMDQLMFAAEANINSILTLAGVFPEIEIFCVQGNHGRAGKKGDHHPRTNFDNILYWFMQMALKDQKNVKVYISKSPTMLVRNGEYNFALNHNDDVRGWMGIPFYGLARKEAKMNGLYGMTIHYNLGGHFHEPANIGDKIIVNGTMVGGSDLSINRMHISSEPCQKIFYFHPKNGINRESNLKLDTRPILTTDDDGIFTAHD